MSFQAFLADGAMLGASFLTAACLCALVQGCLMLRCAKEALAPGRSWTRLALLLAPRARAALARKEAAGLAALSLGGFLLAVSFVALGYALGSWSADIRSLPGAVLALVVEIALLGSSSILLFWCFHAALSPFSAIRAWSLDPAFAERCHALKQGADAQDEARALSQALGPDAPSRGRQRL